MNKKLLAYLAVAGLVIPALLGVTNCVPTVQSPFPSATTVGTGTPSGLKIVELFGTGTALAREQTITAAARPNLMGTIEAFASQTAVQQKEATNVAIDATWMARDILGTLVADATQTALTGQAQLGGAILLQVSLPGNEVVPFTAKQYASFQMKTIRAEGATLTGPSLDDIVFHFIGGHSHYATLYGKSSLTLYDNDINSAAILYLTNQGRVNFASTALPSSLWPQDIALIIIR